MHRMAGTIPPGHARGAAGVERQGGRLKRPREEQSPEPFATSGAIFGSQIFLVLGLPADSRRVLGTHILLEPAR
jgi:hypothetical protein